VLARQAPSAEVVEGELERARRMELERSLFIYFDRLKGSYPVIIQDREMAEIALPVPGRPS
jgi:hypothetical protein